MRILILLLATSAAAQVRDTDWLTYGHNLAGWRFSELAQITPANVKSLTLEWVFQTGVPGKHESTPLIKGNVMYVTGPENTAFALDLATGRQMWKYSKPMPAGLSVCCGLVNRGFAMAGDTLFKTNLDATLVAIDAKTGATLWETPMAEVKKGFSGTVAPLIVKDKVVVGIAGAEFGTRCFIDAYDIKTGKRAWRFYTVPGPGEEGGDTWPNDNVAYQRGGGSTWITGTYDPALNTIYWGTGNPGPDMNGNVRKGDNLYTCSLVALDADTGKRKWHFQYTPHDVHDWDATEDPVLLDVDRGGRKVKAVVMANRNGFYYVLDRTTGEVISAEPYDHVTVYKGVDLQSGRIRPNHELDPTLGRVVKDICPAPPGAKDWQPTAFSPRTKLLYVPHQHLCANFKTSEVGYIAGTPYVGADVDMYAGPGGYRGEFMAWDPVQKKKVWAIHENLPVWTGTVVTAGDVAFYGTMDRVFKAVNARTGDVLWQHRGDSGFIGQPVTYMGSDGVQYVAILSGVGGWPGVVANAEVDPRVRTSALGFTGATQDLPLYTAGGSSLMVFGLPKSVASSGSSVSGSADKGRKP